MSDTVNIGYGHYLMLPDEAIVSINSSSNCYFETHVKLDNIQFATYVGFYPYIDYKNVSIRLEWQYDYPMLIIRFGDKIPSDIQIIMISNNASNTGALYLMLWASNVCEKSERELINLFSSIKSNISISSDTELKNTPTGQP
jgi:hypothetical protein